MDAGLKIFWWLELEWKICRRLEPVGVVLGRYLYGRDRNGRGIWFFSRRST